MKKIFEYRRPSGRCIAEIYDNSEFYFLVSDAFSEQRISSYSVFKEDDVRNNVYLGRTREEVLDSGRDILGEALIAKGDPDYEDVKSALPRITEGAYAFIGGPSSWSGLTVEPDGSVLHQISGQDKEPIRIFDPREFDGELGAVTPRRMLVGGEYPILISLHTDGERTLEFLYFVEPGDPDRAPMLWVRSKKYTNLSADSCEISYKVASFARDGGAGMFHDFPTDEGVFLDAFSETLLFWLDYAKCGSSVELPNSELERVTRGSMAFAALTFTGDHPHYGHKFYGKEFHDNFPPNYIWSIEAAVIHGRAEWAREIFSHLLRYGMNSEGRICYRQGFGLHFGASAAEYGMLLYLANKYRKALGLECMSADFAKRILGMGEQIFVHCIPCPEFDGLTLVKMCAEADTNERVNVYLNNNLWAIRGFDSLVSLLSDTEFAVDKFRNMRGILRHNIDVLVERYSVKDTRFGTLAPFRFGYTATPLTLSNCKDTYRQLNEEEKAVYFSTRRTRGKEAHEQDITENTYANYRYYPEALSSMLLPTELADNMVKLRENLGGEILGMTRFRSWIDNWPVAHYARFLIESGRIEKFLLLLYAHVCHHGRLDLMAYYEQVTVDGRPDANDCVPSLLTVPLMVGWMFAYETVADSKLRLLSALPKKWYSQPFAVKGIGYSKGMIDIVSDGAAVSISFDKPTTSECELVWRAKEVLSVGDVIEGMEYVKEIKRNILVLKSGIKSLKIKFKGDK